jgi:hypothetical protein
MSTPTNERICHLRSKPSYYSLFVQRMSGVSLQRRRGTQSAGGASSLPTADAPPTATSDPDINMDHELAPTSTSDVERMRSLEVFDSLTNMASSPELTGNPVVSAPSPSLTSEPSFSSLMDNARRGGKRNKPTHMMRESSPVNMISPNVGHDSSGQSGKVDVTRQNLAVHKEERRRGGVTLPSIPFLSGLFTSLSLGPFSLKRKSGNGKLSLNDHSLPLHPHHVLPTIFDTEDIIGERPSSSSHYPSRSPEEHNISSPDLRLSIEKLNAKPPPQRGIRRPTTSPSPACNMGFTHSHFGSTSGSGSNHSNYASPLYSDYSSSGTLSCSKLGRLSPAVLPLSLTTPTQTILSDPQTEFPSSHDSMVTITFEPPRTDSSHLPYSTSLTLAENRPDAMFSQVDGDWNLVSYPPREERASPERELYQESHEDLDQLQRVEPCHEDVSLLQNSPVSSHAAGNPLANSESLPKAPSDVVDEDSRLTSQVEFSDKCQDIQHGNGLDSGDRVENPFVPFYPPVDRVDSPPRCRSPFMNTLLLPAFVDQVDDLHTSAAVVKHRKEREWSGQWNTDDIQDVIQKLRALK